MSAPAFIILNSLAYGYARLNVREIRSYRQRDEGGSIVVLHKLALGDPLPNNELAVHEGPEVIDAILLKI